jgi:hypothetical protein
LEFFYQNAAKSHGVILVVAGAEFQ